MKADELDRKFDAGDDITKHLDFAKACRPGQELSHPNHQDRQAGSHQNRRDRPSQSQSPGLLHCDVQFEAGELPSQVDHTAQVGCQTGCRRSAVSWIKRLTR